MGTKIHNLLRISLSKLHTSEVRLKKNTNFINHAVRVGWPFIGIYVIIITAGKRTSLNIGHPVNNVNQCERV